MPLHTKGKLNALQWRMKRKGRDAGLSLQLRGTGSESLCAGRGNLGKNRQGNSKSKQSTNQKINQQFVTTTLVTERSNAGDQVTVP